MHAITCRNFCTDVRYNASNLQQQPIRPSVAWKNLSVSNNQVGNIQCVLLK